ncbi:hypothetical protein BJ138DRAFT_832207 [Hygrophoropsis aurantiaca]|uniref:Uncharacterized protein n=1 Tax=Hygrophoropsis aurantiaca TaxID=72124 RepID=A0ACB8AFZ9_9AGAM|nr:hypothetical protein BJ138DRAFT_832207 [Hygrophoropsis aurantiaca]
MSTNSMIARWTPLFIGSTVSFTMYGTILSQYGFYLFAFPDDKMFLKALVSSVFVLDTMSTYGALHYQWEIFIRCHKNISADCQAVIPWQAYMSMILGFHLTFVVQSFYAHRVWIMSGHNSPITAGVVALALAQLVTGMVCSGHVIRTGSTAAMFDSLATGGANAAASATCDILITSAIFYYLRLKRTDFRRREAPIERITKVFINSGLFTCMASLITLVLYCMQGRSYMIGAIGTALGKSYVNSMLAVLNARKLIRERKSTIVPMELQTL